MEGNNIFALIQYSLAGYYLFNLSLNPNNIFKIKSILMFLLIFFLLIFSNSKSPIFVLLVGVFILYYYRIKRIKFLKLLMLSIGAILFFNLWELVFREYLVVGEFVSVTEDASILLRLSDFMIGNFMQLQVTSIIIESYPYYYPYIYGSSIFMIFLIFIPRSIFPEKPLTAAGDFTVTIWPEAYAENGTTLPPGLFGELYMNFSWIGIVIGMFLIGLFYKKLWVHFKNDEKDSFYSFCFLIFQPLMLHLVRGELSSPLLLAFFFIVPVYLMDKIKYKPIIK